MPRLLGKPSKTPVYFFTILLIALLSAVVLEYSGTIDVIPNFGQDRKITGRSKPPSKTSSNNIDVID
jgi:hypothetical protein